MPQVPKEEVVYDKKYLSKQLLSQVHLCRFLYKLIMRMQEKLSSSENEELATLKEYMTSLIFEKLEEVENTKQISSKYVNDYKQSTDFNKIIQIIDQYRAKYSRDLNPTSKNYKNLNSIKD